MTTDSLQAISAAHRLCWRVKLMYYGALFHNVYIPSHCRMTKLPVRILSKTDFFAP